MSDRLPFELCTPGTWLAMADRQVAWQIQTQLRLIESAFAEAAMAVILFEQCGRNFEAAHSRQARDAHQARISEVQRAIEEEFRAGTAQWNSAVFEAARIEAGRQVMLENLQRGVVPQRLLHTVPFIYAKAFLYAADEIGKIMDRLAEESDLPEPACDACRAYYSSFPSLREVRHSAQHIEDRGRGLGRGEKPLDLKPVNNRMVTAPGGALIVNSLNGNNFGATMADGHYGEVEVSRSSLATIRDHVELLVGALPWTGPEQHFP